MEIINQQKKLILPKQIALIGNFSTSNFPLVKQSFLDFFEQQKIQTLFAKGYEEENYIDEALLNEAQRKAQTSDMALLLLYAPKNSKKIPISQYQLIRSVSLVQKKIIVLVHAKHEIESPWKKYTYISLKIDRETTLSEIMKNVIAV